MIEIIHNESTYDEYQNNIDLAEEIGKVEIGVDNIETVSRVINYNVAGKECPICKELLSSCNIIRETNCKHLYCNDCINKWLKKINLVRYVIMSSELIKVWNVKKV